MAGFHFSWLRNITYHIFLSHTSADSHFICLHYLDIVNSDAVSIGVRAYFWIGVFIFSRSVIGGSHASFLFCFIFFLRTSILFSIQTASVYISTNSVQQSLFSAFSPAFVTCRLFDDSYSKKCEMIPYCGFDFHFSYN